jgi:hypothetical protein
MQWRFLRLNWSYAVGELFIVTAGVLIALAVNEWNNHRLERAEEAVIVESLVSDLQSDLSAYQLGLDILDRKEESLRRIQSVLASAQPRQTHPKELLEDVVDGANYGWNQHRAQRTTFDELVGSGKLGLIRDAEVREAIGDYYKLERATSDRINERETAYPRISYQLVPRTNESGLDPTLDRAQIELLAAAVVESTLREHLIAEINFARFVRERFTELQSMCSSLLMVLQNYLNAER